MQKRLLEQTKCDGIMIGRGALGSPWIFEQVKTYLQDGTIRKISNKEKIRNYIKAYRIRSSRKRRVNRS